MKIKGYKSSASRLARFFERSRDKWRAHAAEKQKKLRALETRVRDLERSRAKWKGRALQAEQTLAEGEASKSAQGGGSQERDEEVLEGEYLARGECVAAARGHRFDLEWVQWALVQLLLKLPTPRSKARWQQMSKQVRWAVKALAYYDRGQFTELVPGYRLDGQTQDRLRGVLNETQRYRLNHRVWRDYDDEASYLEALWERRRSRPIAKRYATPVS